MRIAAVSMVKNECDIIELFIKINSKFFDAIYILDHGSTDSTAEIIKLMKKAGYKVYYTLLRDTIYNQSKITTEAVRQIAQLNLYDYIMPIDADEFIPENGIQAIGNFLQENDEGFNIGYFPWKTYCPVSNDFYKIQNPLYKNFIARRIEPVQFYKIIISNQFEKNCIISMAYHHAINNLYTGKTIKYKIPLHLKHVPIRSKEQAISKVILGSHAFELKKDRRPGEGFHWDELANKIRMNEYSMTNNLLFNMAMNYAVPKENWIIHSIENQDDAMIEEIGSEFDLIEYKNLAKIDLLKNLDMEIKKIITMCRNTND